MPTRPEFEIAAEQFLTAAGLISDLATSAQSTDVTQVLRGGSLGRRVAERVAAAASAALSCHQQVVEAAETCLFRAEAIAAYEIELASYDVQYGVFQVRSREYGVRFAAWFLDDTGTIRHPGAAPVPPIKPTSPGDWAEVQRR